MEFPRYPDIWLEKILGIKVDGHASEKGPTSVQASRFSFNRPDPMKIIPLRA